MNKPTSIRVAIADDHSVMREGLSAIINREPDMGIVAEAANWPEAVQHIIQNQADIAVLDLHMRGMEPAEGIAALQKKFPGTRIVIFSAFGTCEEVKEVLQAGARGYILKGESGREDLLACIRAVARGEIWIHPFVAARLAEEMTSPSLTLREKEVLRLMAAGKSNKEIGSLLEVTEGTIKVHVNHILGKLGATGRVEAILAGVKRGLVHLVESYQDSAGQQAPFLGSHFSAGNISKDIKPGHPTGQFQSKR